MSHGPAGGNAEQLVGNRAGRALAAADIRRPGAGDGAVRALGPAGAELQHRAALRRAADAVGLGGDEALVVHRQQREGLDQLGLNGRSPDRQDRLPGENRRALGNSPDIARKLEIPEVVQKFFREQILAPEIVDILLVKMQILDIIDQPIQARADGKAALVRYIPEKDVKISNAVLITSFEVTVAHGQLIKIAEHRHVQLLFGIHSAPRCYCFVLVSCHLT